MHFSAFPLCLFHCLSLPSLDLKLPFLLFVSLPFAAFLTLHCLSFCLCHCLSLPFLDLALSLLVFSPPFRLILSPSG